ncbi:11170_t:CDS:1 [Ambispora gerdemannii]|uniref:11170_t:CDS:1 n=1 Tax=Ambispora gerdemannii TaxID=144530 RepID=A0A9N9GVJ0_9GLOM|nr:11170_t:CDS:1 [Ambispora gerdemannii]
MELGTEIDTKIDSENSISNLPVDCFARILTFLIDDENTLFSAALVNRTWCRLAIPFLWNSFHFIRDDREGRCITETLIRCMNDEERNAIINSGLRLKKSYPQPLFLYTSFIKNFDLNKLKTVVSWYTHNSYKDYVARDNSIRQNTYDSNNINQIALQLLTQTYKLIFRTAENLESFDVTTNILSYFMPNFTSSFHTPSVLAKLKKVKLSRNDVYDAYGKYEESEKNLENLRYLINALKLLSRNIRVLEIDTNVLELNNIHQFCDLLEFQHNLKHLILKNIGDEHVSIIHALHHQAKSLVYLEFRYSSLSIWTVTLLKKLGIFTRMEGIAFMECEWNSRHENLFIDWWTELSQFPTRLNKLYFDCTATIIDKIMIPLIKIVGNNLKELRVRNDCTQQLIEVIAEHAKNISSLEIWLNLAAVAAPFLQTITSLQSLQLLILINRFEPHDSLSDDFWIELSKTMNPDMKFYTNFILTPHALASLLLNHIQPSNQYFRVLSWSF